MKIHKKHQKYSLVFIEIIIGVILSLLSFFVFIDIAKDVLEKKELYNDLALSHLIYSFRNPPFTTFMEIMSFLGNEFVLIASFAIVVSLLKNYKKEATLFAFTIGMGYLLNSFIKYLFKVPRPDIDPISFASYYSFPSGHAMNSFIFYIFLSYMVFHFTRNKKLSLFIVPLSFLLILLIGFSRVYLGVHYPSDVIAGFIAGFWWVVTVIVIDKTIFLEKQKKH